MRSKHREDWTAACLYELNALEHNKTWELVDLPPGRKAIPNKWVFKHKADGRYHACLIAKGFTQVHGINYTKTFSPVS